MRSWQEAYRGLIPQDYLDGLVPAQRLPSRRQILESLDWSRAGSLVAIDDGRLAGFADFGPTRDDDEEPGSVGEIMAIYLEAPAWGKGIGRKLMSAALASLARAGYGQVTLWVLDSNRRARTFYEAAGFRPDGSVKYDRSRGFRLRELRYRRPLP